MLKITLRKSLIGASAKQKATAKALGLNKINSCVEQKNNVATQGMINVISHLVEVEEVK